MSNARKLQTEIDRVMKKVDEGVELFDEIWLKVKNADAQNLKEKHEVDLKKEIKKLQRLRDQIKTWIGSSDVKDKDALIDARKRIETKMEQFKICEKETKTKTYSKEGLAREEKLDPVEEAKLKTTTWIANYIERFQEQVEEKDFEIEKLSSGKGKKTNKHQIEELQDHNANHKYHISKLEGIIRLVNNDVLDVEPVDNLKEDLDYYLDSYEDEDYMMAYDEEFFYESLGLEELDVVNVDRVTQAPATNKKADDATSTSSRGSKDVKDRKKSAMSSVIPLTIGRARSKADKKAEKEREEAEARANSTPSKKANATTVPQPAAVTRTASAPAPPPPGASMAAILKRETEQQEKERQKQEQLRQQQLKQQELLRQQEALRAQQEAQAQQEALERQQEEALQAQKEEAAKQQAQQQQEAAATAQQQAQQQQQAAQAQQQQQQQAAQAQQQQAQLQAQQQRAAEQKAQTIQNQQIQQQQQQPPPQPPSQGGQTNALDILTSGLGGLGLGAAPAPPQGGDTNPLPLGASGGAAAGAPAVAADSTGSPYITALNDSFGATPGGGDAERSRQYTPQNPYPTPASYPSAPSAIFDNPAVFEKLGTDCLFFIFYYAQGTYQQYLAARELKKQSWRFHKKYMTWFQRHEEPKITTDEYEQGTYVYFDYEAGWCTRIKQDFRFEYSFLEDSL